MQVMIDHVLAVVIGTIVILALAAMTLLGQDGAIEAAQVDAGKVGLRQLIDMVEQDVANMGSGMASPNGNAATAVVTAFGASGGYQVLTFQGLATRDGTPVPEAIQYRWQQTGTATLTNGATVPTYLVERRVGGAASGESFDSVTGFTVGLLDSNLQPVPAGSATYHPVRYVNVDVAMVSPLGTEGVIEQTRWAKRFRPVNLDPGSRQVLRVILVP